jgi:hypothetical protein
MNFAFSLQSCMLHFTRFVLNVITTPWDQMYLPSACIYAVLLGLEIKVRKFSEREYSTISPESRFHFSEFPS